MTARNSILLIIKQQPGIEYNTLLNKISGNYGSLESARAALSRSIRYLTALGYVARRENSLFTTGKGTALLNNEMQNKLLMKINTQMAKKDKASDFDKTIELMQTLIERSKQDRDLLVAAKGSASFYVTDLVSLQKEVEKKVHSLEYLSKIFEQQISAMKELDFPDFKKLDWSKQTKQKIKQIPKKTKSKVFTAECQNNEFRKKAAEHFQAKGRQNDLFIETKQLPQFLNLVENRSGLERNPITLYIGGIKIKIDYPRVYINAAYQQLQKILEK